MIPTPIDARPAGVSIPGIGAIGIRRHVRRVWHATATGCRAGGFANRQAHTYGELEARPNLRKPGSLEPLCKFWQQTFLRYEYTIGRFGENIGGLGVGPALEFGKALCQRLFPVLHRIVRAEDILP